MKFRLTILAVILTMFLGACSLAEDITPPPGYQPPTTEPSQPAATPSPQPSLTPLSPTATVPPTVAGTAPAVTQSTGTPEAGSPTPAVEAVTVSGAVTNSSGQGLQGGLPISLYLYNASTGSVDGQMDGAIQSDGTYQFTQVKTGDGLAYFVTVKYAEVTYASAPVSYTDTISNYNLPVTVYESTNDLTSLTVAQVHMSFDFSVTGKTEVQALYILTNSGPASVIVPSDGSSVPFIQLPAGAADTQFSLAQGSAPLMSAANGFAFIPGMDKQYGIYVQYSLPYTRSLKIDQPFKLPVTSETVIVPQGVNVRSDQLKDNGTQDYQGKTFRIFQGDRLAANSSLVFSLSGLPGTSAGFQFTQQTYLLIAVAFVGLLMIGLGLFFYLRDRKRAVLEAAEEQVELSAAGDALGVDPDSITDAIIALDNSYRAGEIAKDVYDKRRAELKQRLKDSL